MGTITFASSGLERDAGKPDFHFFAWRSGHDFLAPFSCQTFGHVDTSNTRSMGVVASMRKPPRICGWRYRFRH